MSIKLLENHGLYVDVLESTGIKTVEHNCTLHKHINILNVSVQYTRIDATGWQCSLAIL